MANKYYGIFSTVAVAPSTRTDERGNEWPVFGCEFGEEIGAFRYEDKELAEQALNDPASQIVIPVYVTAEGDVADYPDWMIDRMEEIEAEKMARQAA